MVEQFDCLKTKDLDKLLEKERNQSVVDVLLEVLNYCFHEKDNKLLIEYCQSRLKELKEGVK